MKSIYSVYGLLIFLFCGCSDFLSEYSQDQVRAKTVTDFDEVLLGSVYIQPASTNQTLLRTSSAVAYFNIMDDDVSTVRAESGSTGSTAWSAYTKYQTLMEGTYGYYTWQMDVRRKPDGTNGAEDNVTYNDLYTRINYTNVIIDELADVDPEDEEDALKKNRVLGESHFLRAQFYFILANIYGAPYAPSTAASTLAVPLKLTAYVEHVNGKKTQFERATLDKVYAQIVEDLKTAITYFQQGEQLPTRKTYRANEEAAQLLLSRVYLYMQDWESARTAAETFLKMDVQLVPIGSALTSPFLTEDNNEVLFSQSPQHLQNIFTAVAPDFCVSSDLYNLYEEGDNRASFFQVTSSDSIALVNKLDMEENMDHRISDALTLRTAEGYLNMAEACAMLDDPEANTYLNTLRRNRISNYVDQSYTGDELIEQVRLERRKELCFEGHRWFDLRRYTVCERLPYHKSIRHDYHIYDADGNYSATRVFVLGEDETNVWTFLIPETVLEFDTEPMPNNEREEVEELEDMNDGE